VRALLGPVSRWGVSVDGQHVGFSIRRWRVRIPHALFIRETWFLPRISHELGLWPNWIRQRPFKPRIVSSSLTGPMMFFCSRSSIGRAAGRYPVSAGLARDPSSNLGGSMKFMASVAQLVVAPDCGSGSRIESSIPITHLQINLAGPWASQEWPLRCRRRDRGFKSHRPRQH
jgi:hypothetical protein